MKKIKCQVEEKIAAFQAPNNNTFPLWCYGAPTIVRYNDQVYATIPDANLELKPMINTRLQLFRKQGSDGWERIYVHPIYDQREPCPIASMGDGRILVSTNSAIAPFYGFENDKELMWYCEPYLFGFNVTQPESRFPEVIKPAWDCDWPFTDHSYRGIASDPVWNELFVMNIEGYQWKPGPQGRYHWAFRNASGRWESRGRLDFPVRCCYPCISLDNRRLHILATSDIEEPNDEWMAYKRAYAGTAWDYDFRKLHYVYANDIATGIFEPAVVIESVDETAGHIKHFDLYVDRDNVAHILYLARNIAKPFMRDKFWPDQRIRADLKVVRVMAGVVLSEQVIASCLEDPNGRLWSYGKPAGDKNTGDSFRTNDPVPNHAAFHATPDGRLFVVYNLGGFDESGTDLAQNYLVEIMHDRVGVPIEIEMEDPLKIFFTAAQRIGSTPSQWIDLFGVSKNHPNQINYARVEVKAP